MEYQSVMLVVENMEKSKEFYKEVLKGEIISDLGANVTFAGGYSLQTKASWLVLTDAKTDNITYGGNDAELYFEETDFDDFLNKIEGRKNLVEVIGIKEMPWGQRSIRFYDLDKHVIEVGESMKTVCNRFLDSGLTVEETAKRMDVPLEFVLDSIK